MVEDHQSDRIVRQYKKFWHNAKEKWSDGPHLDPIHVMQHADVLIVCHGCERYVLVGSGEHLRSVYEHL